MRRITRVAGRALLSAVAIVVGYGVLALTSTLVQQTWLGGVSYVHSPVRVLVLAGIFTPLGGVLSGWVTAAISRRAAIMHGLVLSCVVMAETTYLYMSRRVDGPLWFEEGAGVALAVGVVAGCWLWKNRERFSRGTQSS